VRVVTALNWVGMEKLANMFILVIKCQKEAVNKSVIKRDKKTFECSCHKNYKLVKEKYCKPLNPCEMIGRGGCEQKCVPTGDFTFKCECIPGYKLSPDQKMCNLIHACEQPDKGGCEQKCIKQGDSHQCGCNEGFRLGTDGHTCEEIKPCENNENGGCDQICINDGSSAKCACNQGYKLMEDQKKLQKRGS